MSSVTVVSNSRRRGAVPCTCVMPRPASGARMAFDVRYCDATAAVPPPAMLVGDVLVAPSDGVIVSPTTSPAA